MNLLTQTKPAAVLQATGTPVTTVASKHRTKIAALILALVASLFSTALVSAAPPASADTYAQTAGAYLAVATGAKNYSNHTQWIGNVTISACAVGTCGGDVQVWGEGFYSGASYYGSHGWTFPANRWVPSGTNVCGAVLYGSSRAIACIHITV